MDEEYNSSVMQFMVHNYYNIFDTDDFDKFQDMLLSPIVKKFVNYMWMFNPMTILEICNTEKYYTEENRKIIDELYIQYEQYYFQRQHESQEFYNNHQNNY